MADKMLIDASHEEETRVVVVRGNRIEEFDFESQHKKQLRGNIYLAKVTRVEPSLQAAFVDYGGNRHGFLAFSEIHPDYYQIPLADRQALLAAEAEAEAERARSETEEEEERFGAAGASGEDDAAGEEAAAKEDEKPKARRSRSRRSRKTEAKVDQAAEADVESGSTEAGDDAGGGAGEENAVSEAASDLNDQTDDGETGDGSDTGDSGDDQDDNDSGPRSMAAIVETDSVSEPVEERQDDDKTDGGEVDEEAAKFVEGKGGRQRSRRSRRGGKRASAKADDESARQDDDGDNGDDDDAPSGRGRGRRGDDHDEENGGRVESVGAEDAMEEVPDRSVRKPRKQYRIQEVIKRRQILLVQVVKEERGNKGAALTTYLSLAGRYSVLMPNTARGGGISRKITNIQDRKRLKEIAKGLDVPQGMGVILRTAGANRTKAEVKRDFEYLMRLWENVRNLTLSSTAPCLVYEEGSLIKRSIRDLYNKDISQIVVSGEEGYREAKDFMKMLMPSHAKVVQPYRDVHPIFSRQGIEAQLDRMLQPQVNLKSGGYIIINQTEALVAIDVNSGRSTREHSIEDTALQTNLEAADEVARQLRLRDLAGLIVVDFIDMEEKRNNRSVEKRLKDALKNDRARIQVGRISHFGLLEMSRQRIRASVLESTTQVCEHCGGSGHVRSQSSVALHVIRSIEEYLLKSTTHDIIVRTMPDTALYVLNQKRATITEMERRFGVSITIEADGSIGSAHLEIQKGDPVEEPVRIKDIIAAEIPVEEEDDEIIEEADEAEAEAFEERGSDDEQNDGQSRRKRRRRRRGGRDRDHDESRADDNAGSDEDDGEGDDNQRSAQDSDEAGENGRSRKRRRRGKRGGRRNRGPEDQVQDGDQHGDEQVAADAGDGESDEAAQAPDAAETAVAASAEAVTEEPAKAAAEDAGTQDAATEAVSEEPQPEAEKPRKPRRSRAKKAQPVEEVQSEAAAEPEAAPVEAAAPAEPETAEDEPAVEEAPAKRSAPKEPVVFSSNTEKPAEEAEAKPKKVGWWQRRSFF